MAVPAYTNDLTNLIEDADTTAWTEITAWNNGGAPDESDTESALQGTNTVSQSTNTVAEFSMVRILGTPVTLSSGYVFLVWHGHGVATALGSYANGGLRLLVATDVTNWKSWDVGGNDTPPFPYGKWVNNPIDPTLTPDDSLGTPPTTNYYGVGSAGILTKVVFKGQPHVCDIIRYGRAEARIYRGSEADGYATFSGFAAANDASTAKWGLIQATDGGYLWKGLMTLGYSEAVDFRDSNKTIFVQDTRKVSSGFNKIEIRQALSRVDWTGISLVCLSPTTTASKGAFEVIDNADVNFDNCSFTDLTTFIFQSNSTVANTVFRRCGQITPAGANMSTSTVEGFEGTADTAALVWDVNTNTNGLLDNMSFTKGTAATHAIELGTTSPTAVTFNGISFSGYNASNGQSDSTILVSRTTGTVTISITGGGDTPSYKSAGATVVISSSVNVTVTIKNQAGDAIPGVQVAIFEDDTARTVILVSTSTDENGEVATSAPSGTGAIIIRARQSTNIASFLTSESTSNGIESSTEQVNFSSNH
ncbi:hypothetical protein A2V61_04085, partial [Candidatus Woesebacteria bacterium RBG_19FT_COMBO_47_8]